MQHTLRLNLTWSRQFNNENVLGQETSNGITTTHVYGSNRIFERNVFSVQPEYEFINSRRELRFSANVSSFKSLTTQMFPLLRFTDYDMWAYLPCQHIPHQTV